MSIISPLCVLPPDTAFAQVQQTLTTLGWQPQADPTAPPPLMANEPDMALWLQPTTGDRLTYTHHPVTHLRVLLVEGPQAAQDLAQLVAHLPTLTATDAEHLMQSLDGLSVLLGIAIAEVLQTVDHLDVLAALMEHPDEWIAQEATRVFQRLLTVTTTASVGVLANWQAQHPGYSALFRTVGGCHERRQVLRWLMRDRTTSNTAIEATLRTALTDPDWEVRITAVLVAARLSAVGVRNLVHQVALPDSLAEGLDANDRRILQSIKQAAQRLLEGQLPPQAPTALATREAMQAHIQRCILGLPVPVCDRVFLFIQALTQPLPAEVSPPAQLPTGLQPSPDQESYTLGHSDLKLVWVPPIPHWLGDERNPDNPTIRTLTPHNGFFISQTPLTSALLHQLAASAALDTAPTHEPYHCPWPIAHQHCLHLSQHLGIALRLPTADEWEMAVRGPDGRRFPWGNGLEKEEYRQISPWGVQDGMGAPIWTSTLLTPHCPFVCGQLTKFGAAGRIPTALDTPAIGFRILVEAA
jgi:Sulfatase-modifying factor enzyme 1